MENNSVPPPFSEGSPQQAYHQHVLQQSQDTAPIVSVKEWMLTMLLMIIPVVNIIMMFVFAFGEGNPSKQNYFKAALIWAAIILAFYLLIVVLLFGTIFATTF
ncbi:hypothetical protein [Paenibacillus sp. NPDC057967]|uniref:hypothetical protein n=1 Tax=Paenibacillus sp. NPDC057967 TaxID=3346293 RepID=UPI0036DC6105